MGHTVDSVPQSLSLVKSLAAWIGPIDVILTLAAAPFLLFPNRWTPAALGLIAAAWVCRWAATGRLTLPTAGDVPLALILGAALLGLCVSPATAGSLPRFWSIVLGVAIFYALANQVRSVGACRLAVDLLLVAGAGLVIVTLLGTDWLSARMIDVPLYRLVPPLLRDPADGALFNPRTMGMALAVLLPVPLASAFLGGRATWHRLLSLALAAVMAATAALCQSLQAMLGVGAALLLLAAWRSRWYLLAVPVALGLAAEAVVVIGLGPLAGALLSIDHPAGVGVVLRLDMWTQALAMIRDLPYTGIGLDAFATVQSGFYVGFLLGAEPHAHNLYLQIALDLGLAGLYAFLWLILGFGRTVARAHARAAGPGARALLAGTSAGVAAYLAAGLIDTPWATKPGVLLWVLLGLGVAAARVSGVEPPAGRRRWIPAAGLVALVAASLLLWPGLVTRNLGLAHAQRALVQARSTLVPPAQELAAAVEPLREAMSRAPGNADVARRLGSVHAWLGDYPASAAAIEAQVALDAGRPMERYAPFEALRRRLAGETGHDAWDDLLKIYSHWQNRYPDRAEGYVRTAIVWHQHRGDPARARAALQAGLDAGAQPAGLLAYYMNTIGDGR